MKKWYTIGLLVLVVVFAAAMLVACEYDEETTTTAAVDTTMADMPDAMEVAWADAADHLDETVKVVGPVLAVDDKGSGIEKYLINIGSTEEGEGFNALVNYADADKFGDLNDYVGMNVAVTGLVYENQFELKAEIECLDPSQIEVLGPAAEGDGAAKDIGVYFTDQGDGVVLITDVPAPGMEFPIHTGTDEYASVIEAFDAEGNSLGNLELPEADAGVLDYSAVDGIAKIVVTTFAGVPFEYMIP
jgi:hypothetical protein